MRQNELKCIRGALEAADLVLIGASNGLDIAEGFNIFAPDQHFVEIYGDLACLSGAHSILEGMHLSRRVIERQWAWHARFGQREWLDYQPSAIMDALKTLVGDTEYFIVTCNVDGRFARAGFNEARILETEGSVRECVCSAGCSDDRYPAQDIIAALANTIEDGRVNVTSIPRCPHCKAPLVAAVDVARLNQQDRACAERLRTFQSLVAAHHAERIVVLELGVGLRNGIIKHLLANAVKDEQLLTYAIFNYNQVVFPPGLENKCIGIDGDMAQAFADMMAL